MKWIRHSKAAVISAIALALLATPALAGAAPVVQSGQQALAQDAALYAVRYGLDQAEAEVRLGALQASWQASEQLRKALAGRIAGVSIEHRPQLQIVFLLTGTAPVAATSIAAGAMTIPVQFRTGARASADEVSRAMLQRGEALSALVPRARGMGLDPRTGELVLLVDASAAARIDRAAVRARAEALSGVPVRIDLADPVGDLSDARAMAVVGGGTIAGGGRIEGTDPADGRRYACTTGFAVSDGARSGLATAAHCPDEVVFKQPGGADIPLAFAGQWGARTQDVQINLGPPGQQANFFADRRARTLRQVTGARSRPSTRGGEWLCHYGESSGYSCAEVELVNFAPPGALCGGLCAPTWVTVRTHDCHGGDSGGPVFSGTIAFGITKGGSGGRGSSARCNFYFYMSTDFLPAGWRLMTAGAAIAATKKGDGKRPPPVTDRRSDRLVRAD